MCWWEERLTSKAQSRRHSEGLCPFGNLSKLYSKEHYGKGVRNRICYGAFCAQRMWEGGNIVLYVPTYTDSTDISGYPHYILLRHKLTFGPYQHSAPVSFSCSFAQSTVFHFLSPPLAFLYSPFIYSLTPRSALFLLWVNFILPQSLLSGLQSIPESGRSQANEGNTQSFGNVKHN